MKQKILQLTIVTAQGVRQWNVGVDGLASITIEALVFTGDPFDHYVGKDENGATVFTLYPLSPVEVVYATNPTT